MSGIHTLGMICVGIFAALVLIMAMGIIAQCVIYLCLKIRGYNKDKTTEEALKQRLKERYKNDIYS